MNTSFLPDDKTMCHRTGFTKSCRACVVDHGCKLWVRVTGRNKDTDAPVDMYDCADAIKPLMEAQGVAQLSQMLTIVAKSVDHLRIEVQGGRIDPLLGQVADLNDRFRQLTDEQQNALVNGGQRKLLRGE